MQLTISIPGPPKPIDLLSLFMPRPTGQVWTGCAADFSTPASPPLEMTRWIGFASARNDKEVYLHECFLKDIKWLVGLEMYLRWIIVIYSLSLFSEKLNIIIKRKQKMNSAVLISSIVVIIGALIGGAFALAAAKRTAKAQKAQSYIDILQKKVETLTNYIKTTVQLTGPTSTVTGITQTFERIWNICVDEPTLFTECKPKFEALELKRKEIKEYRDQVRLLTGTAKNTLAQKALQEICLFCNEFDNLLKAERDATIKKIEEITFK